MHGPLEAPVLVDVSAASPVGRPHPARWTALVLTGHYFFFVPVVPGAVACSVCAIDPVVS